jgi:hypothetical protein
MKTASFYLGFFFIGVLLHTVFVRPYDDITIFKAIVDAVLVVLFFYTSIKKPSSNV